MPELNEDLINDLDVSVREGLNDAQLCKKHDIAESTWFRWKRQGTEDLDNGFQTLHTILMNTIKEGRGGVNKQIENRIAQLALANGKHLSVTRVKNQAGTVTRIVEQETDKVPSLEACKTWLHHKDPDN